MYEIILTFIIHDYELPFEIDEYTSIEEVNRLCAMVEELDYPLNEVIGDLMSQFCSLEELYEHKADIIQYPDCENMVDVAYYLIDECGSLGEIPDRLKNYIDYEAYARDLDIEGYFVETRYGVFKCLY